MSKADNIESETKTEDAFVMNDNDSDKTDFNTNAALKESEAKIEKLTVLLAKLKKALENQTNKTNEKIRDIEKLTAEKKDLEDLVEKFVKEENSHHLDLKTVQEIKARVAVQTTIWCCLQTDNAILWKREETLTSTPEGKEQYAKLEKPRVLDYIETLKKMDEDTKKYAELEHQMMEGFRQYEERLQKMRGLLEESDKNSKNTIQELKSKQLDRETLTNLLSSVINESAEIRENNLIYLSQDIDNSTKEESIGRVKISLFNLKKKEMNADYPILNELRNHLLLLHETLFDSLKRLSISEAELFQAEKNWKKTVDNLVHEIEKEKKDNAQLVELGRKKIKDLEGIIENIKVDAQRAVKERDIQIDFLGKELKKNANVQYIKNIVLNFLTNPDYSVREKLIPVLGTVLQFSSTELESAKTAWDKDNKSLIGKGSTQVTNVI